MNPASPLSEASRLVVKTGLRLGLLTPAERGALLAVTWAALPSGACSERDVNVRLQAALSGPAACLDTDHVELRRWLVDAGWLRRDGYGRAYQRAPLDEVPAAQARTAAALAMRDVAAWVADERDTLRAVRHARHQAWQQAQGPRHAGTTTA